VTYRICVLATPGLYRSHSRGEVLWIGLQAGGGFARLSVTTFKMSLGDWDSYSANIWLLGAGGLGPGEGVHQAKFRKREDYFHACVPLNGLAPRHGATVTCLVLWWCHRLASSSLCRKLGKYSRSGECGWWLRVRWVGKFAVRPTCVISRITEGKGVGGFEKLLLLSSIFTLKCFIITNHCTIILFTATCFG
jgi:hypothetical protein